MLDIEIIPTPGNLPIQDLLAYLNSEIYAKMSKKDVEVIKSKYLGGYLVHAIDVYKNKCVYESLAKIKEQHTFELNNLREIIKGLRDGRDQSKEVYPSNGFTLKD